MPEIVSDGDPFQMPQAAANETYARATPPSFGSFVQGTLEDAGTAFLGRAAERGTQADASSFDRGMAAFTAQSGAPDQPLISVPEPAQSPTIPPEQANDLYAPRDASGKTVPITDKPISEGLAQIIGRQKADAMQRESVLSRFAETHWGPTTFVAGALASMLDPLNVASMFIPGVGEGAIAARLGGGFAARAAARLAAGAEIGAAAQAPVSALKYGLAPEEASDYGIRDAMRDMLYGAAGVALLHTGIGTAGDLLGRAAEGAVSRETAPPKAAAILSADAPTKNAAMRGAVAEIADGRPVDVAPVVGADEPQTFTTAKGSVYTVNDDGSTTRNKSFHPEHGEADQGPQPRSETTLYVTDQDAIKLAEIQSQGGPSRIVAPIGDGRWGVKYADGKDAGKFEARTVVTPQAAPAVGLTPVELWQGGQRVHFGNEITEVRASSPEATATDAVGRQADQQRAGWASGVSPDELTAANDAVYGPKPEDEQQPEAAAAAATAEAPAGANDNPELAAAEQKMAQIAPENLAPEDQAELDRTAEGLTKAEQQQSAYEAAAACLTGEAAE